MFAGIFSCTPSFSPEINKVYLILSYLILSYGWPVGVFFSAREFHLFVSSNNEFCGLRLMVRVEVLVGVNPNPNHNPNRIYNTNPNFTLR